MSGTRNKATFAAGESQSQSRIRVPGTSLLLDMIVRTVRCKCLALAGLALSPASLQGRC